MKCFDSYCVDNYLWVLKYYPDEIWPEHIDQAKSEDGENYDEGCFYVRVYYHQDTQELLCSMMYICDNGIDLEMDYKSQDIDWLLRDVQKQIER